MGTIEYLNEGDPLVVYCHFCGAQLRDDRAVARTPGGVKFFCRASEEQPLDSCYNSWRRRGFM